MAMISLFQPTKLSQNWSSQQLQIHIPLLSHVAQPQDAMDQGRDTTFSQSGLGHYNGTVGLVAKNTFHLQFLAVRGTTSSEYRATVHALPYMGNRICGEYF
jgi:hypothetical protein